MDKYAEKFNRIISKPKSASERMRSDLYNKNKLGTNRLSIDAINNDVTKAKRAIENGDTSFDVDSLKKRLSMSGHSGESTKGIYSIYNYAQEFLNEKKKQQQANMDAARANVYGFPGESPEQFVERNKLMNNGLIKATPAEIEAQREAVKRIQQVAPTWKNKYKDMPLEEMDKAVLNLNEKIHSQNTISAAKKAAEAELSWIYENTNYGAADRIKTYNENAAYVKKNTAEGKAAAQRVADAYQELVSGIITPEEYRKIEKFNKPITDTISEKSTENRIYERDLKTADEMFLKYSQMPDWEEKSTKQVSDVEFNKLKISDFEDTNNYIPHENEFSHMKPYLSDKDKQVANYIYNTEGPDAVEKWAWEMNSVLRKRKAEADSKERAKRIRGYYQEVADDAKKGRFNTSGGAKIAAENVLSIGANIIGGITSGVDIATDLLEGREYDPYTSNKWLSNYASDIRGGTAQLVENLAPNFKIGDTNVGSFLYQTGMSAADSLVGGYLAGSAAGQAGAKVYSAILGLSAANSESKRLYEEGADATQVLWGGITAGAAEAVFEEISLDKLIKAKNFTGIRSLAKEIAKQGLVEGSEEFFTEIANTITNTLIMGNESDWEKSIRKYKKEGKTQAEAEALTFADKAKDILWSFAGGAISGAGMGATYNAVSYSGQKANAKDFSSAISQIGAQDEFKRFAGEFTKNLTETEAKEINKMLTKNVNPGWIANALYNMESVQNSESLQAKLSEFIPNTQAKKLGQSAIDNDSVEKVFSEAKNQFRGNEKVLKQITEAEKNPTADAVGKIILQTAQERINNLKPIKIDKAQYNDTINYDPNAQSSITVHSETGDFTQDMRNVGLNVTEQVLNVAQKLDMYGAQSYIQGINQNIRTKGELVDYTNKFMQAYEDGRINNNSDVEGSKWVGQLNSAYFNANNAGFAWRAGRMDAQAHLESLNEAAPYKTIEKGNFAGYTKLNDSNTYISGDIDVKSLNETQKLNLSFVNQVARLIGKNTNFVVTLGTDINGKYNADTNSITVDLNSGNNNQGLVAQTLAHELTHMIKEFAPSNFDAIANYLNGIYGREGVSLRGLVSQTISDHAAQGHDISYEVAYEEVVAKSMESMLQDGKVLDRLVELENIQPGFLQRVKNFIHNILNKLKSLINNYGPDSAEGRFIANMQNELSTLEEMYAQALNQARANAQNAEIVENDGVMRKTLYKLRDDAKQKVESILNDNSIKGDVALTENSPSIIVNQKGVKNYPMYMKADHIRSVILTQEEAKSKGLSTSSDIHYHGLGETKFFSIIEEMDKLNYGYRGTKKATVASRRSDYFLLVSNEKDNNGNNIIVPILTNQPDKVNEIWIDFNRINTVFGKKNAIDYLSKEVSKGNLVKIKNRSTASSVPLLLETSGDRLNTSKNSDTQASVFPTTTAKAAEGPNGENILPRSDAPFSLSTSSADNENIAHQKSIRQAEEKEGSRHSLKSQISEYSEKELYDRYLELAENPKKNAAELRTLVNEAAKRKGYSRSMFHGSRKSAEIKAFKDWQYFTENKAYAERYADAKLYEVFVKLGQVFDTREESARELFYEARNEYGMSNLNDNGLPDWTDGYDICDYIDENDLKYDSVVLDEGGDMVDGKPVSRGESYVVRKSAQVKSADIVTYDDKGKIIPLSDRFNEKKEDTRYSLKKNSITTNMSDEERARILSTKDIIVPIYDNSNDEYIDQELNKATKKKFITKALKKVGDYFGIFHDYHNADFDIEMVISHSTIKETTNKNITDPKQIAKVLPNIEVAIENAVGIEIHMNRYFHDENTIYFANLIGGYLDGEYFIPVRFGVKIRKNGKNNLYVMIDDSPIKKERVINEGAVATTHRRSIVSLPKVLQNVNNIELLKYIPNEFLSEANLERKKEKIASSLLKTNKKNNDNYERYRKSNDYSSLEKMLSNAVRNAMPNTKIVDENGAPLIVYHGSDERFHIFDISKGRTSADIQGAFFSPSKDEAGYYGPNVRAFYLNITNPASGAEALNAFNKFKGQNDAGVKAREYLIEQGYDGVNNDNEEYIAFYPEQIKSAELITYDDNDVVIPISERFNMIEKDTRHSLRNSGLSTRNILATALNETALNEKESGIVSKYLETATALDQKRADVDKLKAERKALMFRPGKRDTVRISELTKEINRGEAYISRYDRTLLQLQAMKPMQDLLAREKQKAFKKAQTEGRQALAEYREKSTLAMMEQKQHYIEKAHSDKIARDRTAMKNKVWRVYKSVSDLLLKGTNERNVKTPLRGATAKALQSFDMTMVDYEARLKSIEERMANAKDPTQLNHLQQMYDKALVNQQNMTDSLNALRTAYQQITSAESDSDLSGSFDDTVNGLIEEAVKETKGKNLAQMSLDEMTSVYKAFQAVSHQIKTANKNFAENLKATRKTTAENALHDIETSGKEFGARTRIGMEVNKYFTSLMKPAYFFEYIKSPTMQLLFDNLVKAEGDTAVFLQNARDFCENLQNKYEVSKWKFDKFYTFEEGSQYADVQMGKSTRTFDLNLNQMMEIYILSLREEAKNHLLVGGFTYSKNFKKDGKLANISQVFKLSEQTLDAIAKTLSPEQRNFAKEMQKFLASDCAEAGNKVSQAMYGVDNFTDKNYFPMKSSSDYTMQLTESDVKKGGAQMPRLKNMGFTKKLTPRASNPLVIDGFMNSWGKHVAQMANYSNWTLPLEDIERIYKYKLPNAYSNTTTFAIELEKAYGSNVRNYLGTLIDDLNGGFRGGSDTSLLDTLFSKFKKNAVFMSASVVVQQPSAILRAAAYIDPKYFVKSSFHKPRSHTESWAEVKKYAPVAIVKEMGGYDMVGGQSTVEWLTNDKGDTRLQRVMNKADDIGSWGPGMADELSWVKLWNVCKAEIADNYDIKVSEMSEAQLKEAGKRFTDVVVKSQVYDSTLSRSGIMRSTNGLNKLATAFMAEPMTQLNMLMSAARQMKNGQVKVASRVFASITAAVIVNNLLKALVTAGRKDDKDKIYEEKYVTDFVSGAIDDINPLTLLPIFKDVWSTYEGYTASRSDLQPITDLAKAFTTIAESITDDKAMTYKKWEEVAGALGAVVGVPIKNIMRDGRTAYNIIDSLADETDNSWADVWKAAYRGVGEALPFIDAEPTQKKLASKAYKYLKNGDYAAAKKIRDGFGDDKKYYSKITEVIKDAYQNESINIAEARSHLSRYANRDAAAQKKLQWLK